MKKFEIYSNYLKRDGLKITNQRISILKCIKFFKSHFNADDIYEFLKEKAEKASRASVYRMLPFLKKDGIIKEVGRDSSNKIIYEYVKDVPHHDHLICVKCGKIIEFKNDDIEYMQKKVCQKYNFILKEHIMELKGLCENCHKKEKK